MVEVFSSRLGESVAHPKASEPASRGGYNYVIREVGTEPVCFHKVGIAKDTARRLAGLQNANGRKLVLVAFWHTVSLHFARHLERITLSRFSDRRQCGEWLLGDVGETVEYMILHRPRHAPSRSLRQ